MQLLPPTRTWAVACLLAVLVLSAPNRVSAGTAFTYQGQLTLHGSPVNAACSMQFRLFNQSSGGSLLDTIGPTEVPVSNGVFTTLLDFGAEQLGSGDRWLEISVDCGTGLIQLAPRQAITAVPYAVRALAADNPAIRSFDFTVHPSNWDDGKASGGGIVYPYKLPASMTGGKTLLQWLNQGAVILGYAKPAGTALYKQMPNTYTAIRTPSQQYPATSEVLRIEILPEIDSIIYSRTSSSGDGLRDLQAEVTNQKPAATVRIVIIGPN